MNETETERLPLDPDCRVLEGASGVPVTLADGLVWLLADGGLNNALDALRDRIDDAARLTSEVATTDVREVAFWLLKANYDLNSGEAAELVLSADAAVLTEAVMEALFGPHGGHRTYTRWASSALLANGIDPASVPVARMPDVLAQLEATGRCVARDKFIDSAVAAPRLAAARARAAAHAAHLKARAEAETDD